jgi:hypothetical protein
MSYNSNPTVYPQNTHTVSYNNCGGCGSCSGCAASTASRVVYDPPVVTCSPITTCQPQVQPCSDSYVIRNPNINSISVADGNGGFYETSPANAGQVLKAFKIDPLGANRPSNLELDFAALEASDIDSNSWANLPNGIIPASKINGVVGTGPVTTVAPSGITGLAAAGNNKYVGTDSTGTPGIYSLPTPTPFAGITSVTQGFGTTVTTSGGVVNVKVDPTEWVPSNPTTSAVYGPGYTTPTTARTLASDGKSYAPGLTATESKWWATRSRYGSYPNIYIAVASVFSGFIRNTDYNAVISYLDNKTIGGYDPYINVPSTLTQILTTNQALVYSESLNSLNETLVWNQAYSDMYRTTANPAIIGANAAPLYFATARFQGSIDIATYNTTAYTYPDGKPVVILIEFSNDNFASRGYTHVLKSNFNTQGANGGTSSNFYEGYNTKSLSFNFENSTILNNFPNANKPDIVPGKPNITLYWRFKAYAGSTAQYGGGLVSMSDPRKNNIITLVPVGLA